MTDLPIAYWLNQSMADLPKNNDWLSPGERNFLNKMRFPKRRADWTLGRWTAKCALSAYFRNSGSDIQQLSDIEIRAADDGAPEAFLSNKPAQLSISISHSNGVGFCVVSPSNVAAGCDLEKIESRSKNFISDYFTSEESRLVFDSSAQDQPMIATLIWSAKESAMKALRLGLRLDTRSVEVSLGKSEDRENWTPLSVLSKKTGQMFNGWWRCFEDYVQTVVAAPSKVNLVRLTISPGR